MLEIVYALRDAARPTSRLARILSSRTEMIDLNSRGMGVSISHRTVPRTHGGSQLIRHCPGKVLRVYLHSVRLQQSVGVDTASSIGEGVCMSSH